MIGFGMLAGLWAVFALWVTRRAAHPKQVVCSTGADRPVLAADCQQLRLDLTEMGRQPWVVFGLMQTKAGVSPTTNSGLVATSSSPSRCSTESSPSLV